MTFKSLSKTTFNYLFIAVCLFSLLFFTFILPKAACAQGLPLFPEHAKALGNSPFADFGQNEMQVTVKGVLTILHSDDFANKRGRFYYFLRNLETNETLELSFANKAPGYLRSGSVVTAHGKAKGRVLYLAMDESGEHSTETLLPAQVLVAGEQKTLVMVANFLDVSLSCSVANIQDLMFTDPTDNSIDDLYTETSFGNIWFDGDVVGPYTIGYRSDLCDFAAWTVAVEAAALADGIDPGLFSRKVYVFPRNACPAAGLATLGGDPSRAWIFTCDIADIYGHELGHNLGMSHAATPTYEYGDNTDIMGLGQNRLRQINAPHKEQMGWLSPDQITPVTDSGIYYVAPLEIDPFNATAPQALKIAKPDTNEYYYLSYRRAIGFDANLSPLQYLDQLSVHQYPGDGSASKTYLLDVLADGESFVDSVNNMTFTQISHSDAYTTVRVQMDATCLAVEPIVDISPTSLNAAPGTLLRCSVTVSNEDTSNCTASTFDIDAILPEGWTGNVLPGTVTLEPGQSGSVTVSVISPTTATEGSYVFTVNVTDPSETLHSTSVAASYSVEIDCTPGPPMLDIFPVSQSELAGATLDYTITVNNTDSPSCPPSSFSLSPSLPTGWTGSVSPNTLMLSPSQSGTAILSVTSSTGVAPNSYGITVNVSDDAQPVHNLSTDAIYVVEDIDEGDTESPTIPLGLKVKLAGKNVKLSWLASTDNVGVSGYAVWRDGVHVGDTSDISYTDRPSDLGNVSSYAVSAYDEAGNMSQLSDSVSPNVILDPQPNPGRDKPKKK